MLSARQLQDPAGQAWPGDAKAAVKPHRRLDVRWQQVEIIVARVNPMIHILTATVLSITVDDAISGGWRGILGDSVAVAARRAAVDGLVTRNVVIQGGRTRTLGLSEVGDVPYSGLRPDVRLLVGDYRKRFAASARLVIFGGGGRAG
jgi:hypothetical protein